MEKTKFAIRVLVGTLTLMTIFRCGGSADYYENLSGDYFFRGGDGDGDGILSSIPNRTSIYGKVIKYKFDDNFIIALQKPDSLDYKSMISFELRNDKNKYPKNSAQEVQLTDELADSILLNDPYYKKIFSSKENYWIISHEKKRVYGPLSKHEYLINRKKLNVPKNLQLEEVE